MFSRKRPFPLFRQLNAMDCGPTCIKMIARYYGRSFSSEYLRKLTGYGKAGVSMLSISEASEKIGFKTRGVRITLETITEELSLPCILHWEQSHFVVLLPKRYWKKNKIAIADPVQGKVLLSQKEFLALWAGAPSINEEAMGFALLMEPAAAFYDESEEGKNDKLEWRFLLKYLRNQKWMIAQVFIALIITSMLQLIFPYLTQSVVDTGINTQNIQYVTVVLAAQLMLTFSRTMIDFIRTRLLMRVSMVLNLLILSDFWIKLTRLPMSYLDSHHTGDILQRINDNKKIQSFLTGSAINIWISAFNFLVFSVVLVLYNVQIFTIFMIGSFFYLLWIAAFLGFRRRMNHQIFKLSARENSATLQLVQGMTEIKMNNAERMKRWDWENIQAMLFKLNLKNLTYSQAQGAGALLISQGKDIVISFLVAKLVIEGQLTFGAMLAVQYVIGQLSGPVEQIIGFVQSAQDTKMSIERINDIHQVKEEEDQSVSFIDLLPEDRTITFSNLNFSYPGSNGDNVLNYINLTVPEGKVTAIVGASGSGKTSLLKLLLKFYDGYEGDIKVGNNNFRYFSPAFWRKNCSAVLQDGYIFDDTIANNIAVGDMAPDIDRLIECCKVSNILSFIESTHNGFNTKLGATGVGISQGQKQRLLIARAIYKNPHYLLLDEATNSLDANNEREIVDNLNEVFKNKTVIVVAHRLSTVKNAQNIVVLDKGEIVEQGTHEELATTKGRYFQLIKNQLELGV